MIKIQKNIIWLMSLLIVSFADAQNEQAKHAASMVACR